MIGLSGPNFLNRPMAPISWCVLPSLSAWFGHFFGPLGLLFSRYFYITVIWLTQSRLFLTSFIYLSTILFLIIILSCFRHWSGRFPYGYYHMCLEGNVRVQTILLICDIDDLVGVSSWIFDRNNYHGWCFVKECFARAAGLRLFWTIYSIELEKGFLMGVLLLIVLLLPFEWRSMWGGGHIHDNLIIIYCRFPFWVPLPLSWSKSVAHGNKKSFVWSKPVTLWQYTSRSHDQFFIELILCIWARSAILSVFGPALGQVRPPISARSVK